MSQRPDAEIAGSPPYVTMITGFWAWKTRP